MEEELESDLIKRRERRRKRLSKRAKSERMRRKTKDVEKSRTISLREKLRSTRKYKEFSLRDATPKISKRSKSTEKLKPSKSKSEIEMFLKSKKVKEK